MEIRIDNQAKGTRIITGQQAKERRRLLNKLINIAEREQFDEIVLPSIELSNVYTEKAGGEILNQMYNFFDKKNRKLCLRPEGTATIQLIADKHYKRKKDIKFWYFEKCWRYENIQAGRYREFYQFGLEIINPSTDTWRSKLISLAREMVSLQTENYKIFDSVKRGLNYYIDDGFEISVPSLGAQKQVVGGGSYLQGIGFGVGFDRLMLC